jgi:hypothetical protein
LCWRHSGFSVDNSVRLDGGDHKARQALAQYIARAPLSLQKLSYDRPGGKVIYHTAYNPYFKQNTTLWDAMDFIAALTQFVPPLPRYPAELGVRCIHYYGLYSSRCKGRWQRLPHVARVAPAAWKDSHPHELPCEPTPNKTLTVPQGACRSAWARLIAKVYEIDVSGGSWPRSGQREPVDLSSLWIRDEAHSGHHQSLRSGYDPAPPYQDRQGTAGT